MNFDFRTEISIIVDGQKCTGVISWSAQLAVSRWGLTDLVPIIPAQKIEVRDHTGDSQVIEINRAKHKINKSHSGKAIGLHPVGAEYLDGEVTVNFDCNAA